MKNINHKLQEYKALNKGLKKQLDNKKNANIALNLKRLPLIALGALGIVGTANAQCVGSITSSVNVPQDNNTGFEFDIGLGVGNDFRIFEQPGVAALKLQILNANISVLRVASHTDNSASAYKRVNTTAASNFAGGDFVNNGNNPLFLHYGGGVNGQWGDGVSGYVIFKHKTSGELGFFQLRKISGTTLHAGGINIEINEGGISTGTAPIIAGNCASLPVEFISFTAQPKETSIELQWATASEINNAGFEVQRSANGTIFKTLGFIDGHGNSNVQQEYFFEDREVRANKKYYYRLKQIDFDGKSTISDVVEAQITNTQQGIQEFYPNPSKTGFTNIDYPATANGNLSITVYDVAGRVLHNESRKVGIGLNSLQFDFTSLSDGSFFVKLEQDGEATYKKLMITKD